MSRTSKKAEITNVETQTVEEVQETQTVEEVQETQTVEEMNNQEQGFEQETKESVITDKIPPRVEKLMRLYPQYEEFWVTPNGFVHPKGASSYLIKDATLYKNLYFNKSI